MPLKEVAQVQMAQCKAGPSNWEVLESGLSAGPWSLSLQLPELLLHFFLFLLNFPCDKSAFLLFILLIAEVSSSPASCFPIVIRHPSASWKCTHGMNANGSWCSIVANTPAPQHLLPTSLLPNRLDDCQAVNCRLPSDWPSMDLCWVSFGAWLDSPCKCASWHVCNSSLINAT